MLIVAGGIVVSWLAISLIRAVFAETLGPSERELLETAKKLDDAGK